MFPDKLHVSLFPDRFPHYAWTIQPQQAGPQPQQVMLFTQQIVLQPMHVTCHTQQVMQQSQHVTRYIQQTTHSPQHPPPATMVSASVVIPPFNC